MKSRATTRKARMRSVLRTSLSFPAPTARSPAAEQPAQPRSRKARDGEEVGRRAGHGQHAAGHDHGNGGVREIRTDALELEIVNDREENEGAAEKEVIVLSPDDSQDGEGEEVDDEREEEKAEQDVHSRQRRYRASLSAFRTFSGVKGMDLSRMPQAFLTALLMAGAGPLMLISAMLLAPNGPDGSYDGTRMVFMSGRSRVENSL